MPSRAATEENAYNRMKEVVRWYLSGFYKKPKVGKVYFMWQMLNSYMLIICKIRNVTCNLTSVLTFSAVWLSFTFFS